MYNSETGERFFMKGLTYGYAMDDKYYSEYGEEVINKHLKPLHGHFNTIRLYNINPDLSYEKFMKRMEELGVYVIISAAPAFDDYFGKYKYSTMRKDLGPSGVVKDNKVDQTKSCYPASLLEYGKKVAKNFGAYDHTLSIVIANEIMQRTLKAGACVKQYVSDLKEWMRDFSSNMRIIPISYAEADSAYETGVPDSDTFGPMKIQGLLCGDRIKDGVTLSSIDIFLVNTYRWCRSATFAEAYQRLVNWASGVPIVVALGEFGCKDKGDPTRDWAMIPYLYGSNKANSQMHEIYSGGTAYSYGQAGQGPEAGFPMFEGGSQKMIGKPSDKKTKDFDTLVSQYKALSVPREMADWDKDDKCRWTPKLNTKVYTGNKQVTELGWLVRDCSKIQVEGDRTTWVSVTRNGAVCSDGGGPCNVDVSSKIGTSQKDICGFVEKISGGAPCESHADCGKHGVCTEKDGVAACECLGCYSGSKCTILNTAACAEISSSEGALKYIWGSVGFFLAIMIIIFTSLFFKARSHLQETKSVERELIQRGASGVSTNTSSQTPTAM